MVEDLCSELELIWPWKVVITDHDVDSTKRADNVMATSSLEEGLNALKHNSISFKDRYNLDKAIVIYLASPLKQVELKDIHRDLPKFRKAILDNDESISSMVGAAPIFSETTTGSCFPCRNTDKQRWKIN